MCHSYIQISTCSGLFMFALVVGRWLTRSLMCCLPIVLMILMTSWRRNTKSRSDIMVDFMSLVCSWNALLVVLRR